MTPAFDPARVPSPAYIVDTGLLRANLACLADVRARADAHILLALKGFAMHSLFPFCRDQLDGVCASGLWEARLGREHFGKLVSTYSPAYRDDEFADILACSDHVIFNSFAQWDRFRDRGRARRPNVSFGLRVNPQHSEGTVPLYDPCRPGSRLGITRAAFAGRSLAGIDGLHFHTLCEQNVEPLERTLAAFERQFADLLPALRWVNFGGGHHITRADYGRDRLVELIRAFRARHGVDVYLEPGEAIALNTGFLIATVEDIVHDTRDIAILDVSCTCHMPDVIEMPYRPAIAGAGQPGELPHTYQLAGCSCLAGDVIGEYSFAEPLRVGRRLVFLDMAHYTMVKTTMFNGVRHPAIGFYDPDRDTVTIARQFTYEDYRDRLS